MIVNTEKKGYFYSLRNIFYNNLISAV